MNYTADIRGNLIFDGFEPMLGAPNSHDMHDVDLPSDGVREIAPAVTPALDPKKIMPSEDGWMDPAPARALLRSCPIDPIRLRGADHADTTSWEATGKPDGVDWTWREEGEFRNWGEAARPYLGWVVRKLLDRCGFGGRR